MRPPKARPLGTCARDLMREKGLEDARKGPERTLS